MGKTGKRRKENHTTKVTKIPKTKRQKYGMNETYRPERLFGLVFSATLPMLFLQKV